MAWVFDAVVDSRGFHLAAGRRISMEILRRSGGVFYAGPRHGGLAGGAALRGGLQFRGSADGQPRRLRACARGDKPRSRPLHYGNEAMGILVIL